MNCEKTKKSNTIFMTNTEMITKIMEKIQYFSKEEKIEILAELERLLRECS